MNNENKRSFRSKALLWWISIISLVLSGSLYYFLGNLAETDVHVRQQRLILPLIGILVAGVCLIAGTAGRWFYPK
ncbi:MAG: hypothetical protein V5783_01115 [Pontiella sp.]